MKAYKVEIKGISPLLQNKPEEYGFDEKWIEIKANEGYEEQALKKLYLTKDKKIYQPASHIEGALINAGKKLRIKGQGKSTYSKLFGSMVSIPEINIIHCNQKWDVFKVLVVIPSTKGRVMRYRPRFNDWKLKFTIEFEDEIVASVIKEGLEIAGKSVGIGDWRPEKKGKYGKFQVTSFKEVK